MDALGPLDVSKKTVMQEELRSQVDPSFRDILAEGNLDFGKRGLPRKYGVRQIPVSEDGQCSMLPTNKGCPVQCTEVGERVGPRLGESRLLTPSCHGGGVHAT